ncbi:MAG: Cache 3/Cache 2 fusion domain-containing protein [Spirochaetota bacterium]
MRSLFRRYTSGIRQRILIYILLSSVTPLLISILLLYFIARGSLLGMAENAMSNSIQNIKRFCEVQSEQIDGPLEKEIDRSFGIARRAFSEYRRITFLEKSEKVTVQNQDTQEKESVELPVMVSGATRLGGNFGLIDDIVAKIGNPSATATIFQLNGDRLVRIATNVRTAGGERAILTFIPKDSLVYRTILKGEAYRGRAIVVDRWNITHYEPIRDMNGNVAGALYVGIPAPRSAVFDMIGETRIGRSGYIFVLNSQGQLIAHPEMKGRNIRDRRDATTGDYFIREILEKKEGSITYDWEEKGRVVRKISFFTYFPKWDWIITATAEYEDVLGALNTLLVIMTILLAGFFVAIVFVSRALSARISRPLREIIDTAVKISNGDLDTFIAQPHYVKCAEEKNCDRADCPAHSSRNRACWRIEGTLCEDGGPVEQSGKLETCRECAVYRKAIRNEFDELVEAINNMVITLRGIIVQIKEMTTNLNRDSESLAEVSRKMEIESQSQAASIEETTSAHEELIATIENVAEAADSQAEKVARTTATMEHVAVEMHAIGKNSQDVTERGRDTVREAHASGEMLQNTIRSINKISESSRRIGDIVRMINDVSDQINLLSLNASIEAARAGEYGRGFAVVAEEISKLADTTAANTREIEDLIRSVRADIDTGAPLVHQTASVITGMVGNIEEAARLIGAIAEKARSQIEDSDTVRNEVQEVNRMAGQIALATGEQKTTSTEILKAVARINDSIQEIASSAILVTESARSVRDQSERLKSIAGLFRA